MECQCTNGNFEEIVTELNCAVFESIPDRFLDCPMERLAERRPLFVSVLSHGN